MLHSPHPPHMPSGNGRKKRYPFWLVDFKLGNLPPKNTQKLPPPKKKKEQKKKEGQKKNGRRAKGPLGHPEQLLPSARRSASRLLGSRLLRLAQLAPSAESSGAQVMTRAPRPLHTRMAPAVDTAAGAFWESGPTQRGQRRI